MKLSEYAFWFVMLLIFAIGDITTTELIFTLPYGHEMNTFLYGSHPSLLQLTVVHAFMMGGIFFLALAIRKEDVWAKRLLFGSSVAVWMVATAWNLAVLQVSGVFSWFP